MESHRREIIIGKKFIRSTEFDKNLSQYKANTGRATTNALKFILDFFTLSKLQNSDAQSFFYVKNYPNLSKFH